MEMMLLLMLNNPKGVVPEDRHDRRDIKDPRVVVNSTSRDKALNKAVPGTGRDRLENSFISI
jgi:hypothetical protein